MKKVIITIAIIIVVLFIGIGYFVLSDMRQEKALNEELEQISDLTNVENIDVNAINEKLDRTVTKGDYAVVEQSIKQYLKDVLNNNIQIAKILNDEKITNILTAQNYKENGKDFIETKKYIKETIEKLENYKNEYSNFFTESKVMSYINNKGLDSYYIQLYKEDLASDIEAQKIDEIVENSIDEVISILKDSRDVIDFLSENSKAWEIQNEKILFTTQSLSNKYNELISKIQ